MILKEDDRKAITEFFGNELREPVNIVVFTQRKSSLLLPDVPSCEMCEDTEQLLQEIAGLSGKLKLEVYDFVKDLDKKEEYKVDKIPAIIIRNNEDYGIRFYGIPSGYEFSSLIEAIRDVSRKETGLSTTTKERLKDVNKDIHIQVFVTPTCPYCPQAVRFAHQMALENKYIHSDMVEVQEFIYLAHRYNVFGVPLTVINEDMSIEGSVPEKLFLLYVLEAAGVITEKEKEESNKLKR